MKKQIKKALLLLALLVCLFSLGACTMMMQPTAHTCVDRNNDTLCDTCGQYVPPAVCTVHIDNNDDGICDRLGCGATVLREMYDVTFSGASKTYNGKPWTLEVEDAPEDAIITYSPGNTFTNAGTYKITATVTAPGYQDTELTATLTIKPKNITINWGALAESYPANGTAPELPYTLSGVLEGDTVEVDVDFGSYNFKNPATVKATAISQNPNYTIKTNKTTEVIMGENVHTITFDTNGSNVTVTPKVVLDGTAVDEPRAPSLFGYTFVGWYNGNVKWDFAKPVTEPMTLTAKWQLTEYNINYVINGGENPSGAPEKFTIETADTLPVPSKEGSIFLGWFTDAKFTSAAGKLGSVASDIQLYAKWSDKKFVEIEDGKEINSESSSIILSSNAVNGTFSYIFSATVKSFDAENGVIRIGRGNDTVDGSYIELTAGKLTVYTNESQDNQVVQAQTHQRDYEGFIVVEIEVAGGYAYITLRTASGEYQTTKTWSGRNGEIFFDSENVELEGASFGWTSEAYKELVWIVGDETVGSSEQNTLTYQLTNEKYGYYLAIGAKELGSAGALDAFKTAYEKAAAAYEAKPKYAIWSFRADESATYDDDLAGFVAFCNEKGIIPILTTQSSTPTFDNTDRNAAVEALSVTVGETKGIRYIDFASVNDSGAFDADGNYTLSGAKAVYAKFMVDFPEMVAAAATMRTVKEASIAGVSADLMYPEDYNPQEDETEVGGVTKKYEIFKNHRIAGKDTVIDSAITMNGNSIKNGKYMIFSAKIDGTLGENQTILLGQGYMQSTGQWIEINNKEVLATGYVSWGNAQINPTTKYEHGLTIKNYITVIMTSDVMHSKKIVIFTDGGCFTLNKESNGNTGDFFATSAGVALTDVTLSWTCADYAKDIWVFGDSYLSMGDYARWPTYLWNAEEYYNALMDGMSGMSAEEGIADFEDALNYGMPKYVVWLEGMNNGEKNGVRNSGYDTSVARLFELCEANGIEPIIATIPSCGIGGADYIMHSLKNSDIRNKQGVFEGKEYRVIEWANAVSTYDSTYLGIDGTPSYWYDGMLYTDNVHPTNLGAKALYLQLATDFPEIFGGWNGEITADSWAEKDTLTSGESLTVEAPETFKANQIFTFSAAFDGRLSGTVEIGNGRGVEGGTWVAITSTRITVYQRRNGEDVEIKSIDNKLEMNNILNLKIHVKDGTASLVMSSSGEKEDLERKMFGFGTGTNEAVVVWTAVGNAFVTSNGAELEEASFCWYTFE